MILTDFNGVAVAGTVAAAFKDKLQMEKNIIKHVVISSFRNIHMALAKNYGDHILLIDDRSWRKDEFEFYKASRQKSRDDSAVDWELIFSVMNELREEFDKYFPFYCIKQKGCEADDLIAAFVDHAKSIKESSVIVSKDGDFHQLISPLIKQYNPSKKCFFNIENPDEYRIQHFIKAGDDGIPNVLSDDDTFVTDGKSQQKVTAKRFLLLKELAKNDFNVITDEDINTLGLGSIKVGKDEAEKYNAIQLRKTQIKTNWERNKKLIDLRVPYQPAFEGVEKYHTAKPKAVLPMDTANYFAKNKMVVLMGKMNDFYVSNQQSKKTGTGITKFL